MSEYHAENRISIDDIKTVKVINPIGRIEIIGWDEPDVRISSNIKTQKDTFENGPPIPIIKKYDDTLCIQISENCSKNTDQVDPSELDLNFSINDSDESTRGLQDFIGKIVKVATNSVNRTTNGIQASLSINIPKSLDLYVKNLNGIITITNMKSDIRAKGVNGPISLSNVSGSLVASTVNGPVSLEKSACSDVSLKSVNGPVKCYLDKVVGDVVLKSVNGSVRVSIPNTSDVNLTAKTMHGAIKISSDFKQKMRSSHKVNSIMKDGKFDMIIKTSTGAVTVVTTEETPEHDCSRRSAVPPQPPQPPLPPLPPKAPLSPETLPNGLPAEVPQKNSPSQINQDVSTPRISKESSPEKNDGSSHTTEAPVDIIERMLESGKISSQEAEELRQAL